MNGESMKILSSGNVMKKSEIDVVYVFKDSKSDELRYSIRSVAKNWPHRKIWIVGDKPDWISEEVGHIDVFGTYSGRYRDVNNKLKVACNNDLISDPFWLFNDDFFVMKPVDVDNYKTTYDGTLEGKYKRLKEKYSMLDTWIYLEGFSFAQKVLKMNHCPSRKNFENHVPMLMDKQKLSLVVRTFPYAVCRRSIYMNLYYPNDGVPGKDVKRYNNNDMVEMGDVLLSTNDVSFKGNVGDYIKKKFKEKSRYER